MKYRFLMIVAVIGFATQSVAQQSNTTSQRKHVKKSVPTKPKKKQTPEEAKKEAIKRTLKEKNFHLPDTTHH